MIEFTCPGCKAAHTANEAFADRRAKCVRCGASMYIPRGGGEATFAPHGVLDRGHQSAAAGPASGQPPAEEDNSPAEESRPRKKPNQKLLVGVVTLLLLIGVGAVIYFVFLNKPPQPTKKKVEDPEPPPAPPPPETPYEFVGPLKPPPPPPVPIFINAERLAEELARNRLQTDLRYQGRLVELRGECKWFRGAKLAFRTALDDDSVSAVLPAYVAKFIDTETGQPIIPLEAPAVIGGLYMVHAVPPDERPIGGRPVAVRGVYRVNGELTQASVVRLTAPADDLYLGKTLSITGIVAGVNNHDAVTVLNLQKRAQGVVSVVCRMNRASEVAVAKYKSGDVVSVSGKCSGRTDYEVRLENSTLLAPGAGKLAATDLLEAYETDLLRYPPIRPDAPVVKVTAEELANAYRDDPDKANARYQHQLLEVSGTVLKLDAPARRLRFELPTDISLQIHAKFEKDEFAVFPQDETVVAVRTEFRGAYRGQREIILTDCAYRDPDSSDPKVKKLTADFLPLAVGRAWEAVRVIYPEPAKADPKKPAPKPVPAQAVRLYYQMLPDGSVAASVLQTGTFAADSLLLPDGPEVKWVGKPLKPNSPLGRPVERVWLRVTDRAVEFGTPTGKGADDPSAAVEWKTLLRLNSKAGKTWDVEPAAGQVVQTTVEEFFTDAQGREAVRVVAVMTDVKQPDVRTETRVVYARGVGEVTRAVKVIGKEGERVVFEQRLEGQPTAPKDLWGMTAAAGGMAAVPPPPPTKAPAPK